MPEIAFALNWPIQEDLLLPLKDSVNGYLQSDSVSNIPEFEYFIRIFPNGNDDDCRGEIWIFLWLDFKNVKKVEVDYTFTIESANYSKTEHNVYEKSIGWGFKICDAKDFFDPEKKYIVDGKFFHKVNGIFKFEMGIPVTIIKKQTWIGGELGDETWKNDESKDFTIIVADDKEIKVHKFILGIRSEVFKAMFNSNMKESKENKVDIPDFLFNVVEAGIKIIYDCNFSTSLSLEELMQLLQFFDKYQLPSLKDTVEPFLVDQISVTTVIRLANCSVQTNSSKLKEKCIEFLLTCFKQQTPLSDFKILDKDIAFEVLENSFYRNVGIKE